MCAMCASFERQRFLFYVYDKLFMNTKNQLKILHLAPEKSVYDFISKNPLIDYTCCDIEPENYPYCKTIQKEDGMKLSFKDESFDFILHNHVMEHVPNDIDFLIECTRVLKPEGKMIVSVPFYPEDLCDDTKKTDEERIEFYGQADHLRKYGKDILKKISSDQYTITPIIQTDFLSEQEIFAIRGVAHNPEDYFLFFDKLSAISLFQ